MAAYLRLHQCGESSINPHSWWQRLRTVLLEQVLKELYVVEKKLLIFELLYQLFFGVVVISPFYFLCRPSGCWISGWLQLEHGSGGRERLASESSDG